jgi:predicted RNA-binding Zn-ribbon protein involved in translation (DUF1610 family)
MNDNKIFKIILEDLQNLNEKKKKKYSKLFKDQDGDGKVTRKDVLIARGVDLDEGDTLAYICPNCGTPNSEAQLSENDDKCRNCGHSFPDDYNKDPKGWTEGDLDEKRKRKKRKKKRKSRRKKQVKHDPNYSAPEGSKRDKQLDRARRAYQRGDIAAAARIRNNMEKPHMKESKQINELNELINDMIEEQLLDEMLNDLEKHLDEKRKRKKKKKKKKKGGGLSAAVKKSLDKKADRRCLTRGSVYSEFRKGLAAYLSSGSRKGMSAHQWAHARVNSANPSKSWATVKKRKTCPKKKKKK